MRQIRSGSEVALLVVADFVSWVFSVANYDDAFGEVDIGPLDFANIFLSHGCCDGQFDHPCHGDNCRAAFKVGKQGGDFF